MESLISNRLNCGISKTNFTVILYLLNISANEKAQTHPKQSVRNSKNSMELESKRNSVSALSIAFIYKRNFYSFAFRVKLIIACPCFFFRFLGYPTYTVTKIGKSKVK